MSGLDSPTTVPAPRPSRPPRAVIAGGLWRVLYRHCARRLWGGRPGRRNAVQPNKESFRSHMKKERSPQEFPGRITPSFPKRRPCRDDGLGQAAYAQECLDLPRATRRTLIKPAFSSSYHQVAALR